jgi:uncharacterized protein (DUF488 family)
VDFLADVRRFPFSKRYPHFNGDLLKKHLDQEGIQYRHFEKLGGRRPALKNSVNTAWKNSSFRGYADYMQSEEFKHAIADLLTLSKLHTIAIMCSEAVWWRCHRSLVSDYLKSLGFEVIHILSKGKTEIHPYTSPARIVDGKLSYSSEELF